MVARATERLKSLAAERNAAAELETIRLKAEQVLREQAAKSRQERDRRLEEELRLEKQRRQRDKSLSEAEQREEQREEEEKEEESDEEWEGPPPPTESKEERRKSEESHRKFKERQSVMSENEAKMRSAEKRVKLRESIQHPPVESSSGDEVSNGSGEDVEDVEDAEDAEARNSSKGNSCSGHSDDEDEDEDEVRKLILETSDGSKMVNLKHHIVQSSANTLAAALIKYQEDLGITCSSDGKPAKVVPDRIDLSLEQRLEAICRVKVSPLSYWNFTPPDSPWIDNFKTTGILNEDLETICSMLKTTLQNQQKLFENDEMLMAVQKVNARGHLESLRMAHSLRALVAGKDVDKRMQEILKEYSQTISWYADTDLAVIPFRTVDNIVELFTSKSKILSLTFYLMSYLEYEDSHFPRLVNEMCIHPDLRTAVNWSTGTNKE